uniref:Uncharacterized protein n=1 Tax=Oryza meridionalis TaxID=40149 RepID=A0A0E0CJT2_9ORYZ
MARAAATLSPLDLPGGEQQGALDVGLGGGEPLGTGTQQQGRETQPGPGLGEREDRRSDAAGGGASAASRHRVATPRSRRCSASSRC